MKKFLAICAISCIFFMIQTISFAKDFSDVPKEHWAYKPIMELEKEKILDGYPDGTFQPNTYINRAEFAKILVEGLDVQLLRRLY